MAFIDKDDIKSLYIESKDQAKIWREDYPAYERLADNGLLEGLDPNLPEVNDGSLAAALFKLPKRIVSSKLSGIVTATNRDEAWMSALANIYWDKYIIPQANTQAPFIRKWKDAVRKAAIYGSVPLITLFVETNGKNHADFIVGQPQDVTMEAGKVSDYDSDVLFWDIYFTKTQLKSMIEQAKKENKETPETDQDSYNKWDIDELETILASKQSDDERDSLDDYKQKNDNATTKSKGYKFCIVSQKGVNAPFYMYYKKSDKTVREWSNPDPSGENNINFLYCYQDFINPYGIGIVKLAGGTQNVLDYMRKADVLATQLGLEPPIDINGNIDDVDLDSINYTNRALWFTGSAKVTPVQISNATYQGLPERMAMYKTSLNQLIPTGDTSISAGSGDPQYSKTPAGVKFQAASLSIDDNDFKDNLYITYAAVAKSMINTQFANMEGTDLIKLSDDEREILFKAGLQFPLGEDGKPTNELEIVWDTVRANFDFEVEPEKDEISERKEKLEGLMRVAELSAADPNMQAKLAQSGKKLMEGELFSEMIKLTTDNDKIIVDISPEDENVGEDGQPIQQGPQQPQDPTMELKAQSMQQKMQQSDELHQLKKEKMQMSMQPKEGQAGQVTDEEAQANIQAIMSEYGVDENTALTALAAEADGTPIETIMEALKQYSNSTRSR